jgi:hypothetical protein
LSFFWREKAAAAPHCFEAAAAFFVSGFGGFSQTKPSFAAGRGGAGGKRKGGVTLMLPVIMLLIELIKLAREIIRLVREARKDKKKKR